MNVVYGVHVVRSENIRPTEVIFTRLEAAEKHAREVSRDTGVLASAVTKYALDQLGYRTPVSLFVAGNSQEVPYISDDRKIWANDLMR